MRIFTPRQELPFAGHPSVGAAWAVLDHGIAHAREGALVQECAAGLLPVRVDDSDAAAMQVHVRAPRARDVTPVGHAYALANAIDGAAAGALAPAMWDNGPGWWLVALADGDAVRTAQPALDAVAALTCATGAVGMAVFGRGGAGADADLVVRAFCPADQIPEDPVTGSANACIAAMLHAHGAWPAAGDRYVASQGRELGRDGRVVVSRDGDEIWIGGAVQAVIRGSFDW